MYGVCGTFVSLPVTIRYIGVYGGVTSLPVTSCSVCGCDWSTACPSQAVLSVCIAVVAAAAEPWRGVGGTNGDDVGDIIVCSSKLPSRHYTGTIRDMSTGEEWGATAAKPPCTH